VAKTENEMSRLETGSTEAYPNIHETDPTQGEIKGIRICKLHFIDGESDW
jgi:hypothetical protein